MLELVDGTGLEPTVEHVVARSGISERSIFRYFDNLDDLRSAVIARNFERVEPLLAVDDLGRGSLEDRIARFVETRLRVCEALAGASRLARRTAAAQPLVAADVARFRGLLVDQVRAHFAAELAAHPKGARDDLEVVMDVLVSVEAWDQMATAHGRTRAQIRRAWTRSLTALLGG